MSFPRGAQFNPLCPDCKGKGHKQTAIGKFECSRCNGTGIEGDLRWLGLVAVVALLVWGVISFIYYYYKG